MNQLRRQGEGCELQNLNRDNPEDSAQKREDQYQLDEDPDENIEFPPREITSFRDFKKFRNPKELNFKLIDTKNKFVEEYYAGLEYKNQKIGFGTLFKRTNKTDYEYYEGEFALNYYHGVGFLITAQKNGQPQGNKAEFFKGVRKSDFFKGQINNKPLRNMRSKSFEDELKSEYKKPKPYGNNRIKNEYYGNLENDQRHDTGMNMGMYIYPNKYTYIGQFQNDHFHGIGRIIFQNGNYYEGEWKEGQKSGFGEYVWKIEGGNNFQLQEKFIGNYKFGKKEKGIYEWIDEVMYFGDFKNDLMHGEALIYKKNGQKKKTEWYQGIKMREFDDSDDEQPEPPHQSEQQPYISKLGS